MRLINHQKDNFYHTADGTVIRGTIEMTGEEYSSIFDFLEGEYYRACKRVDTYTRDALSWISSSDSYNDERHLENVWKGKFFSIGVHATLLVANFYSLKRYKNQNYAIKIV